MWYFNIEEIFSPAENNKWHMLSEERSRKYLQTPPQSVHFGRLGLLFIGGGGGFVPIVERLVDVLLVLLELLLDLDVGGGGPGGFVSVVEQLVDVRLELLELLELLVLDVGGGGLSGFDSVEHGVVPSVQPLTACLTVRFGRSPQWVWSRTRRAHRPRIIGVN
jgi:hypothetical protein